MDHIVTPPSNSNHSRDGTGQGLRKKTNNTQNKSTCQNPVSKPRQQDCSAAAQAQYSKFLLA
jgi:hypothetical protein